MKAKEKAIELVSRYNVLQTFIEDFSNENAIECALIAVDEILNEYWSHDTKRRDWWQEVKREIEKLI